MVLTRDIFREEVFKRDGTCVICQAPAADAHHIMERKLWDDGGYYLDNGAALCAGCHLKAESTLIHVNEVRRAAGVSMMLPPHLTNGEYDKWGNPCRDPEHKIRLRGELFSECKDMILKANSDVTFEAYAKYPRTYHLPWSPGATDDDKILDLAEVSKMFEGQEVVITEKMDGENTSMYRDSIHARSISPLNRHESRNVVKSLHAQIQYDIPEWWRICGENCYAKHSIYYENLLAYFLVFSIWNEDNYCISWDDTIEWCQLLNLNTVPVLYRGIWDEEQIRKMRIKEGVYGVEGYTVRLADKFHYRFFRKSLAKWVRKGHVQTDEHWLNQEVKPNKLMIHFR